jgi:hypothetical protein
MAMTPKEKAKYEAAWKDPKNRKSGEVFTPGSVIRGAAKVVAKIVEKPAEKAALKVGQKVGQKIAESTKASKYPSAGGKVKTMAVEGKATVKGTSGSTSTTPSAASITAKTRKLSEAQRAGLAKAADTKRTKEIVRGAQSAKDAAKPVIKKEIVKKRVAQGAAVALAADDARLRLKKKK